VTGPFVGHHHHHWLVDAQESKLEFVFKPHHIHTDPRLHFPEAFWRALGTDERVLRFWWQGSCSSRERILFFEGGDEYLAAYVSANLADRRLPDRGRVPARRLVGRVLRRS
jgi:hypothetical protein